MSFVPDASTLKGVAWRKSSRSNPSGNCVELGSVNAGTSAMRDSKDTTGPALLFPRHVMAAFIADVREGRFRG